MARYKAGERAKPIAEDLGVSMSAVVNTLNRLGVDTNKAKLNAALCAELLADYESGMSYQELADKHSLSWDTARKGVLTAGGVSRVGKNDRRGPENPNWRTGRRLTNYGYWMTWLSDSDPMASMRRRDGYVLEHRLFVARAIGRPLARSETVHHINGDTTDNRLENLQLRQGSHGPGVRLKCLDCGSDNVGHVGL